MAGKRLDPTLIVLVGLFLLSLVGFLSGYLPYPYGSLVLAVFIVARLLSLSARP
ncbi:MAG: hypothetical protein HUJ29_04455 [Gammaproteobacteria bacterium]|nr:hypothetical protein [Gammaproteobacteria bacterium]